jgi:hypothetical protein
MFEPQQEGGPRRKAAAAAPVLTLGLDAGSSQGAQRFLGKGKGKGKGHAKATAPQCPSVSLSGVRNCVGFRRNPAAIGFWGAPKPSESPHMWLQATFFCSNSP